MTKKRLIKKLEWYYPMEKFHAFVSFPAIFIWVMLYSEIENVLFLLYGLFVCIFILYQGQLYWKLKLHRLKNIPFDQEKNIQFFEKAKRYNLLLIALMPVFFFIQYYWSGMSLEGNLTVQFKPESLIWAILANAFAIAEHVNYYNVQLMLDNKYDWAYVWKNKKLKKSSLAKDLKQREI